MRILIFGAGAIGSIYSYFLSKANNEVLHFVREGRAQQLNHGMRVNILDGRDPKHIGKVDETYPYERSPTSRP